MDVLNILLMGSGAQPRIPKAENRSVAKLRVSAEDLEGLTTSEKYKRHRIYFYNISGYDLIPVKGPAKAQLPDPLDTFEDLTKRYKMSKSFVKALKDHFKISQPTSVQMQAIPMILDNRSFSVVAPTGSGKTLAFVVPIYQLLSSQSLPIDNSDVPYCRALVIAPTKELAQQTIRQFRLLQQSLKNSFTACSLQELEEERRIDLAVCTPGLAYKLDAQPELLRHCRIVILDEADELLSSSFAHFSDKILARCKADNRQIVLFSATLPPRVIHMASNIIHSALVLSIGGQNFTPADITQELIPTGTEQGKMLMLKDLILEHRLEPPCLIFVQDKSRAAQLHTQLANLKLKVGVLHGDLSVDERQSALETFRQGGYWVLVCTDVLARGIDCYGVRLVINYDLPTSREAYVHRIGRTGRAGASGRAITFYTQADIPNLKPFLPIIRQSGAEVPDNANPRKSLPSRTSAKGVHAPPKRTPIDQDVARKVRKKGKRDRND